MDNISKNMNYTVIYKVLKNIYHPVFKPLSNSFYDGSKHIIPYLNILNKTKDNFIKEII